MVDALERSAADPVGTKMTVMPSFTKSGGSSNTGKVRKLMHAASLVLARLEKERRERKVVPFRRPKGNLR
jgi:hypothetical protein